MKEEFKKELKELINKHCIENDCDIPDFILAEMICGFIVESGKSIKKTLDWHGCDSVCYPYLLDMSDSVKVVE